MDMDVLVLDSILELFCSDFGYGLTINANDYDPVDIGLQFVQSSQYDGAIAFLQVFRLSAPCGDLALKRLASSDCKAVTSLVALS